MNVLHVVVIVVVALVDGRMVPLPSLRPRDGEFDDDDVEEEVDDVGY
jgi:hypothetical protein